MKIEFNCSTYRIPNLKHFGHCKVQWKREPVNVLSKLRYKPFCFFNFDLFPFQGSRKLSSLFIISFFALHQKKKESLKRFSLKELTFLAQEFLYTIVKKSAYPLLCSLMKALFWEVGFVLINLFSWCLADFSLDVGPQWFLGDAADGSTTGPFQIANSTTVYVTMLLRIYFILVEFFQGSTLTMCFGMCLAQVTRTGMLI